LNRSDAVFLKKIKCAPYFSRISKGKQWPKEGEWFPVVWIRKFAVFGALSAAASAHGSVSPSGYAQANAAQSAAVAPQPSDLSADQLQKLVGKIALYPDGLLAICLPASTQPIQIVQVHRFLDQRKSNSKAEPPKSWDPSVVALLNYPEVPLPIPIIREEGRWRFDTDAGEQEVLARRIGRDELAAIATLEVFVRAQTEYAARRQAKGEPVQYAPFVMSTPGQTAGFGGTQLRRKGLGLVLWHNL
jgi:hypothetical protein